ncbi:MAG: HD domain-containing phosphohydrolase [Bryobacteraceae bacterium]|jgi:diguanylate cyclase (GGDEF)-like protein/putative nucleotidyltransferase with HDIG domain
MNLKAKLYVAAVSLTGIAVIGLSLYNWRSDDVLRFMFYLFLSLLAGGLKVNLPGIRGTMSVCFLFVFIGIADLSPAETIAIGCAGTFVQCFWKSKQRPKMFQAVFSMANTGIAVTLAYAFYHWQVLLRFDHIGPLLLVVTGMAYYGLNTVPVALAISFSEGKKFGETWHNCYFWSFPFYLVGASVAWIISVFTRQIQWQGSIVVLPVIYLIYRSYELYLARLEAERRHVESIAGLHMRTIEALAMAIDAKDHTTHEHLRRVRVYAVEVGKQMGLSEVELEALKAAALLHDIGKLAVPEHIISKPGRLTPEEFEKMKIHPIVGAEILERVAFPYPVAPIVRAHHENWNGTGYPYGLKGEEIPVGARILSAVDCLDALASDRQYRRALALEDAMAEVAGLSGKNFDPRVVRILQRHYVEWEREAQTAPGKPAVLSTELRIEKGLEPAAGFQASAPQPAGNEYDFLCSIAAARQEVQLLFELVQDLGNSLSLDETLSVVAARLKKIVPYDAIAIYVRLEEKLIPQYVNGEDFRLLSSLEIPVGEGLSGWVAQNRKPILNGNPSVEPGYLADAAKFCTLRSALAVPLEGLSGAIGVMTLYRAGADAFSRDHLRILLAISSKVSLAIENALIFRQVEDSATTDYLSGLPNARSLFLRLDSELARSKRNKEPLCVVVCDLDGFKQINDRYGHLEGNKVLRMVSEALRSRCREYDYVARMGGDEFVLLLPGSDRRSVQSRIADLKQIAITAGTASGSGVSLSLGEAYFPEDGTDAEELLAEADRRMYKAKQLRKKYRMAVYTQPADEIAATA